jgi:hypothetical protein
MSTLANIENIRATHVRVEPALFYVTLEDGREIGVPYSWYWRLASANQEQRSNWRFIGGGYGIHWEDIDEDVSVSGLILGKRNPTPPNSSVNL